jgi:MFS family permease
MSERYHRNKLIVDEKTKILVCMSLSLFLVYLPWYNFSAVLKFISAEFQLTAGDAGMILSAYQAGYVTVVLLTGWLADKVGTKRVVTCATLLTGISSTAFVWVAVDKWTILVMRLIIGCASGAVYAPGMALLSNWFIPAKRGHALGAYTGGLVAAYAGGYFIASPVAVGYGWRMGTLATSLPVFVGLFILLLFVKEKPVASVDSYAINDGARIVRAKINRSICAGPILITLAYMGHMWELYAFWGWIGPFMVASTSLTGISATHAAALGSQMAGFIVLVGVPAVWLWGVVADRVGRIRAIIIASLFSLVPEFFYGYLIDRTLAILLGIGLWIGFWAVADSAIYKASLTEMVPPNLRATFLGAQSAVGFGMTIAAPAVFGQILEYYNGRVAPVDATIWGPSFLSLGVGALLAPIATIALQKVSSSRVTGPLASRTLESQRVLADKGPRHN